METDLETKRNRAIFQDLSGIFSPVYKIEGVDSEHLEPLNSINLGVHKAR